MKEYVVNIVLTLRDINSGPMLLLVSIVTMGSAGTTKSET